MGVGDPNHTHPHTISLSLSCLKLVHQPSSCHQRSTSKNRVPLGRTMSGPVFLVRRQLLVFRGPLHRQVSSFVFSMTSVHFLSSAQSQPFVVPRTQFFFDQFVHIFAPFLSVCLSVSLALSPYLSACLSVCLSACLSVCLHARLSFFRCLPVSACLFF